MVRIEVVKSINDLEKITFSGHAFYDDLGKDIVCAAVSSTLLCTVNAILSINADSIEIKNSDGLFIIKVIEKDSITIKLLHNMIRCLTELEKKYPKNIKIR